MIREILFRGKRIDNNEWIEGSLILISNKAFIVKIENVIVDINDLGYITRDEFIYIEVYPETIGQFTGLLDKNNNKIFEDDIVLNGSEKSIVCFGSIGYDGSLCGLTGFGLSNQQQKDTGEGKFYELNFYDSLQKDLEVIGNIHDNVDLLEDKNK